MKKLASVPSTFLVYKCAIVNATYEHFSSVFFPPDANRVCERINTNGYFRLHFLSLNRVRGPHLLLLWILEAVLRYINSSQCVQVFFKAAKPINNIIAT